jgi:hypothetical protein
MASQKKASKTRLAGPDASEPPPPERSEHPPPSLQPAAGVEVGSGVGVGVGVSASTTVTRRDAVPRTRFAALTRWKA